MISSLIFLAIFMVCCPVSTFRRSGGHIVTPTGGTSNSLPQQNFPNLQINESMMLTTLASKPPIMSAPSLITTGMVLPTVSTTVAPMQVINSPVIFIFNESFMLSGTSPALNSPMAPGATPTSPPITTGTVISLPIQVITPPIVPVINDSLMLSSSTLDSGTVPSSSVNLVTPTVLTIDPAFMMTGTAASASIPSVTPAPVDITTFMSYINESFMIQNPTENTVTTASPILVTSPLTTVTLPLTTTTLGSDGSTPNIGSVTTGTPETATPDMATSFSAITTPPSISTPVSATIVPLMGASAITASPSEAALDSAVNDTTEQPINSSSRYQNMRLDCPEVTAEEQTDTSTVIVEPFKILNASAAIPIVGIAFPSEIKIYLNISSLPSISVHVSTEPPVTEVTEDTVIVEVIKGNERFNISLQDVPYISVSVSPDPPVTEVTEEAVDIIEGNESIISQFQNIIFETSIENTVSEAPIYIDLSDPNRVDVDFGTTTSRPQISSTAPSIGSTTSASVTISPPAAKKKFEEKCLEYYNIGKRITRKTKVQVFIIGGENSGEKEFPHMAALGYGKQNRQQWLCGGSLISENYVITAAHCLSARSLGEIQYVRLGTTTLQTETLNSEDFNVIRRIPHPGYVQGKQYNDIALLQLDRPVNLSDYIAPICLSDIKDFTYTKLTALGWGRVEAEGNTSPELKKVDLEYFSNDVCRKAYDGISMEDLPGGISEETQICAGAVDGSRDTCQGDSGGPLQLQQDGRMYLVGITSFGIGCGKADSPGVYTRVSHYIPWIENIIW